MIIACIKVGDKYGPEYVNRLAVGVALNVTIPYEFLCLTDNPQGLRCNWELIGESFPGWWAKLLLFKPHRKLVGKAVVFLDLDTVIVNNIDFLLEPREFTILRDFYWPDKYGSAIMTIPSGFGLQIWDKFTANTRAVMFGYHGDQDWIFKCVKDAALWQDLYPDKIVSYKVHCQEGLPRGAAIVCFHGVPKPHEVLDAWVKENWFDLSNT